MDTLPEELVLHLFGFLDSPPPSELQCRLEPSLKLTASTKHVLKDISTISKRWRRIVLPLLFRHACLRIDVRAMAALGTCTLCSARPSRFSGASLGNATHCKPYHARMVQAISKRFDPPLTTRLMTRTDNKPDPDTEAGPDEASTVARATRFYHIQQHFLTFVQDSKLSSTIRSFVLLCERMLPARVGRFPHQSTAYNWIYPAAAALWHHTLSVIDPDRVMLLAPPTELACLTNATIDTFGDWAFSDMDFHILEMKMERDRPDNSKHANEADELVPFPRRHPSFAESSLVHLRPWSHIALNEGSFLKAYGTYEFFERGPPSLVYSIKDCLKPKRQMASLLVGESPFPALRSLTYTAIFPFSNHADFVDMLPHLEELDLQFAPDPQSGILDDKARTGKAELADCWQELGSAFHDLASNISTFRMSEARFPRLKKFVCRDSRIPALQGELDEIFTPLCLPVWAEMELGVFKRLAMSPQRPEVDDSFY